MAAIAVYAGFFAPVLADDCLGPAVVTAAVSEPLRPCRQDVDGQPEIFACREFTEAGNRYLLLFKGSPVPRVVVLHRENPGIVRVRPADQAATMPQARPEPAIRGMERVSVQEWPGE